MRMQRALRWSRPAATVPFVLAALILMRGCELCRDLAPTPIMRPTPAAPKERTASLGPALAVHRAPLARRTGSGMTAGGV
jgi:hypothetical protein